MTRSPLQASLRSVLRGTSQRIGLARRHSTVVGGSATRCTVSEVSLRMLLRRTLVVYEMSMASWPPRRRVQTAAPSASSVDMVLQLTLRPAPLMKPASPHMNSVSVKLAGPVSSCTPVPWVVLFLCIVTREWDSIDVVSHLAALLIAGAEPPGDGGADGGARVRRPRRRTGAPPPRSVAPARGERSLLPRLALH